MLRRLTPMRANSNSSASNVQTQPRQSLKCSTLLTPNDSISNRNVQRLHVQVDVKRLSKRPFHLYLQVSQQMSLSTSVPVAIISRAEYDAYREDLPQLKKICESDKCQPEDNTSILQPWRSVPSK